MTRRMLLLAPLLPSAAAGPVRAEAPLPPFTVTETERLRVVTRQLGWTVLRDVTAPERDNRALVLIRAQRPVPPEARPGRLAALLRNIRLVRFRALPEEVWLRHDGLPAARIEARGISAEARAPVMVRALAIHAPERSYLLLALAPVADWPALEPQIALVLEGFRPG